MTKSWQESMIFSMFFIQPSVSPTSIHYPLIYLLPECKWQSRTQNEHKYTLVCSVSHRSMRCVVLWYWKKNDELEIARQAYRG